MDRLNLYNHILLNEGAYFFRSGREPIMDRKMKQVFDEVLEGLSYKILTRIVRQKELISSENGETFKQRNSVIQLVWLLNGFISTCKQADFNCRIFCKK